MRKKGCGRLGHTSGFVGQQRGHRVHPEASLLSGRAMGGLGLSHWGPGPGVWSPERSPVTNPLPACCPLSSRCGSPLMSMVWSGTRGPRQR